MIFNYVQKGWFSWSYIEEKKMDSLLKFKSKIVQIENDFQLCTKGLIFLVLYRRKEKWRGPLRNIVPCEQSCCEWNEATGLWTFAAEWNEAAIMEEAWMIVNECEGTKRKDWGKIIMKETNKEKGKIVSMGPYGN